MEAGGGWLCILRAGGERPCRQPPSPRTPKAHTQILEKSALWDVNGRNDDCCEAAKAPGMKENGLLWSVFLALSKRLQILHGG